MESPICFINPQELVTLEKKQYFTAGKEYICEQTDNNIKDDNEVSIELEKKNRNIKILSLFCIIMRYLIPSLFFAIQSTEFYNNQKKYLEMWSEKGLGIKQLNNCINYFRNLSLINLKKGLILLLTLELVYIFSDKINRIVIIHTISLAEILTSFFVFYKVFSFAKKYYKFSHILNNLNVYSISFFVLSTLLIKYKIRKRNILIDFYIILQILICAIEISKVFTLTKSLKNNRYKLVHKMLPKDSKSKVEFLADKYNMDLNNIKIYPKNRSNAFTISDFFSSKIFICKKIVENYNPKYLIAILIHELSHHFNSDHLINNLLKIQIKFLLIVFSVFMIEKYDKSVNILAFIGILDAIITGLKFIMNCCLSIINNYFEYRADSYVKIEGYSTEIKKYFQHIAKKHPKNYERLPFLNIFFHHPSLKNRIEMLEDKSTKLE